MGFNRIVTHNDFDGIVCAALCSHIYGMENIFFTGPRDIANSRYPIFESDIVTDLPYPLNCGMWFDHHPGNLEDVRLRGIDPETIPGRFSPDPSCARTVYDYFSQEWDLAEHLEYTVAETDIIDSFAYTSLEDWREPNTAKNVDAAIKANFYDLKAKNRFLKKLALWIRDYPLQEIANFAEVISLRKQFEEKEEMSTEVIGKCSRFLDEDVESKLVIIDLTGYRVRPEIVRHMAYLIYPQVEAAIVVANMIRNGIKTTNLTFSMSLSVLMNNKENNKDVGEIMRTLNVGDGHAGAGAGAIDCDSKDEMLRVKESTLKTIFELWEKQ